MSLLALYPQEVASGKIDGHTASSPDFAPTILDFVEFEIPAEAQGQSVEKLSIKHFDTAITSV